MNGRYFVRIDISADEPVPFAQQGTFPFYVDKQNGSESFKTPGLLMRSARAILAHEDGHDYVIWYSKHPVDGSYFGQIFDYAQLSDEEKKKVEIEG